MTRCSVSQDELDHDTGQGRWEQIESLFDGADEVEDLPIEMPLHPRDNIVNDVSLEEFLGEKQ